MKSIEERFWVKVDKTGDCWIWQATGTQNGYGLFHMDGDKKLAHRVSWELAKGRAVPDGLHIDHLCRVRRCVRPDHLEAISPRLNVVRSFQGAAADGSCCKHGHTLDPDNTYVTALGYLVCRTCRNAGLARMRAKKRSNA